MMSLKGYRIALLQDYDADGSRAERRQWTSIKSEGFLKLLVYKAPSREWDDQLKKASEEKTTLVVKDNENVWKSLLKRIEEDEFERGVENGVRFTTLASLARTCSTGEPVEDTWGDTCERGDYKIFDRDFFAIAEEFQKDDPRIGFDIERIKELILESGGEMLADKISLDEMPACD